MDLDEAKKVAAQAGIEVIESVLLAWISKIDSISECLEVNYPEDDAVLIRYYLLSLYLLSFGGRTVASESAPSGASRSYRYGDLKNSWQSYIKLLRGLDSKGCVSDLIPANPFSKNIFIGVAVGGCA